MSVVLAMMLVALKNCIETKKMYYCIIVIVIIIINIVILF